MLKRLAVGDRIVVEAGGRIAADGLVERGTALASDMMGPDAYKGAGVRIVKCDRKAPAAVQSTYRLLADAFVASAGTLIKPAQQAADIRASLASSPAKASRRAAA